MDVHDRQLLEHSLLPLLRLKSGCQWFAESSVAASAEEDQTRRALPIPSDNSIY